MQDIYDFNYQGVLSNILFIQLKNRRRQKKKKNRKLNVANHKPVAIDKKYLMFLFWIKKNQKKNFTR